MKICPKCNREIGDVKYCKYCGAKIDTLNIRFSKSNSLLKQNVRLDDVAINETKDESIDNDTYVEHQSFINDSLKIENETETPASDTADDKFESSNSELNVTDNDSNDINGEPEEILSTETPSLSETNEKSDSENVPVYIENESKVSTVELENDKANIETNDKTVDEKIKKEIKDDDTPFELSGLFASQNRTIDNVCSDDDNSGNEISNETVVKVNESVEEVLEFESQDVVVDNVDNEESNYSNTDSYDDEKQEIQTGASDDSVTEENIDIYEKSSNKNNIPVSDIDQMFGDAPTFDIESIKKSYLNSQKEKELNKTQKKKRSFLKNKKK